jgi:transcription elongation factor GreA
LADGIKTTDAVAHFLNSLEPERARDDRDEIERFAEWYGPDRPLSELTGADVSTYLGEERRRMGDTHDLGYLEPLRAFLAYSARLSFTDDDLVPFLRPGVASRRSTSEAPSDLGESAYFVTIDGLAALERELEELKAERPNIAEQLRAAMADKDFRENAPLDAARDAQAHLEARIRQIEDQLRHAVIIDADAKAGRANVGSTVRVLNMKADREQTFHLVSPNEVDPANGKISIESPVGQAVINHGPGDEVTVNAPSGQLQLRVLEVIG